MPGAMFKLLRIAILLVILATVAQEAWLSHSRAVSWQAPLQVAIYPVNGDGSGAAETYIGGLQPRAFKAIEDFFADEAQRRSIGLAQPVAVTLAAPVSGAPPQPPATGDGALANLFWGLRFRYWAWRHDAVAGVKPQVRLFVLYFDPARYRQLPRSVASQRGHLGLVNAFASPAQAGSNAMVAAHELLHTLGATDKYDLATSLPVFPDGYAEPERSPRLPQEFAEIMAGRIPLDEARAEIPVTLGLCLIGDATAAEIGWSGR